MSVGGGGGGGGVLVYPQGRHGEHWVTRGNNHKCIHTYEYTKLSDHDQLCIDWSGPAHGTHRLGRQHYLQMYMFDHDWHGYGTRMDY